MTTEGSDPKTFSSWEDAFQYPVPSVRVMEKQLRRDIESNKEKLRTLVGASYRDLLGTAETIIEMDGQIHNLEAVMGDVGRRCNTRLLEKKERNLGAFGRQMGAGQAARFALISQLAVLRSCPDVISNLLRRKNGSTNVLLAARVLVLSRLLHTKLTKRPQFAAPYIEALRNRLTKLRRRLLEGIEKRFKNLEIPYDTLVEAMCAFSLATSSSAADVIRHFQHLRLEAMKEHMKSATGPGQRQERTLSALRLYLKTLRDVQTIVPSQLSHALQQLKAVPILKSPDVWEQMELNLDIHEKWLGEDIKTFTPYIRHDDLSRTEAERTLRTWAKSAIGAFLARLQERMQDVDDVSQVMRLRKELLELWLSHRQRSMGVDPAEVLDGLREVFVDRAVSLIDAGVRRLTVVGDIISTAIADWTAGVTDDLPSLWSSEMTSMETSNGARAFRGKLMDYSTGKNEVLRAVCSAYGLWLHHIEEIERIIQDAKSVSWPDDIDDADDEDDILDNQKTLLSSNDPRTLDNALQENLNKAFAQLEHSVTSTSSKLKLPNEVPQSIFLLRTWRFIRQSLPQSFRNSNLGIDSTRTLLENLALKILIPPFEACSNRLDKLSTHGSTFAGSSLWEGTPGLPVLPSPWAYRFLLDIVQAMTEHGSDIWSPEAVRYVRVEMSSRIARLLEDRPSSTDPHQPNGAVNGDTELDSDAPPHDERKIQKLFDVFYLSNAAAVRMDAEHEAASLDSLQSAMIEELSLGDKDVGRMRKNAAEYWKRTSLLFGLLA